MSKLVASATLIAVVVSTELVTPAIAGPCQDTCIRIRRTCLADPTTTKCNANYYHCLNVCKKHHR